MSRTVGYRCSDCFEGRVTRSFDASHLMATCPSCGSFVRLLNEAVVDQYEAYESSLPDGFDWRRLDRLEKLLVAERIARTDRTIEEFSIEEVDAAE